MDKNKEDILNDFIDDDLSEDAENAEIDNAVESLADFSDADILDDDLSEDAEALEANELNEEKVYDKFKPQQDIDIENDNIESIVDIVSDKESNDTKEAKKEAKDAEEIDDDILYTSSDKLTFKDDDITIIQQLENVVTWEISGLYNKDGKLKRKMALNKKPPVFSISASDGAVAEFIVSKEMSLQLYKTFETIYKAYFGLDARSKAEKPFGERMKEYWNSFIHWVKFHPIKFILSAAIIIAFIVFFVIGYIN